MPVPFTAGFIDDNSVRLVADELRVTIRLPWMRSIPWPCVRAMSLHVNGDSNTDLDAMLHVVDRSLPARSCRSLDGYWEVGTSVTLTVTSSEVATVVADGALVIATVEFVIPYIDNGDGPASITTSASSRLPDPGVEGARQGATGRTA